MCGHASYCDLFGGKTYMKLLRLMMAAFIALTVFVSLAQAQGTTGTILGDVTDASGARLPGVTVRLLNQATGGTRETLTTEVGSYRFDALPPVDYTVTAEL